MSLLLPLLLLYNSESLRIVAPFGSSTPLRHPLGTQIMGRVYQLTVIGWGIYHALSDTAVIAWLKRLGLVMMLV